MTKEITKAIILQEMQDKLKLREFEPSNFLFNETVVPVYSIEPHLITYHIGRTTIPVSSIGGKDIFTVDNNIRRTLYGYTIIFMAEGAYKVAGGYIIRKNYPSYFLYLDLTKNQALSYTVNLPKPIVLTPGDSFHVNVDEYTSTADMRVSFDYSEEELR